MLIDWQKFVPALALLLVPIGLFHGGKVRHRRISRHWSDYWPRILTLGAHWIDLGRAVLGAWLLDEALTLAPGAHGPARYSVLLTQGAVLLLGIVLQTAVCRETDSLRAPFTFVAGVVIGFLPWQTAAFALSLAAVVALGVRAPGLFFLFVGIAVVPMGFLFSGKSFLPRLSITFVVLSLPLLLSLLARRPLVVEYRARRADSDTVAK